MRRRRSWAVLVATVAASSGCGTPEGASTISGASQTNTPTPNGVEATEQAVVSCRQGYHLECDPNCEGNHCGKPICTCEEDPSRVDQGVVIPRFMVTHVVYAVPGAMSSVKYTSETKLGTTTSTSDSYKWGVKATAKGEGGIIPFGGSLSISAGRDWGSSQSHETDTTLTNSLGYSKPGQSDFIDHNFDEVWFMINPRVEVTVTTPAPRDLPPSLTWKFAANQSGSVPFWLYVGHLKDTNLITGGNRDLLNHYGFTERDFQALLQADPLRDLPPGATAAVDLKRFDPVAQMPYMRPFAGSGSTISYGIERNESNSWTDDDYYGYSTGVEFEAGISFIEAFKASVKVEGSFSWTHSSSRTLSKARSYGESVDIAQPSDSYQGPAVVRVYVDKIWKTFFFNLEPF
jgi:hypothetical protein